MLTEQLRKDIMTLLTNPDFKTMSEQDQIKYISTFLETRYHKNHKKLRRFSKEFKEDIIQEMYVDLLTNRHKYDPKRGAFSTFAFNRFRHIFIKFLRKEMRHSKRVDSVAQNAKKPSIYKGFEEVDNADMVNEILSLLTPFERKIVEMRFLEEKKIYEISKELKVSSSVIKMIIEDLPKLKVDLCKGISICDRV